MYNTGDRRFTQEDAMAVQGFNDPDERMPPKLDDDIKRLNLVVRASWVRQVDDWRRRQNDLPNFSEAVRRLVESALEAEKKAIQRQKSLKRSGDSSV
jgi:hypothetical protein